MKTTLKVFLGLAGGLYIVGLGSYLGYGVYTGQRGVTNAVPGAFVGAVFSFVSAIGFYYFTKFIERRGSSINSLVDLERSGNHNYNVLGDNIGILARTAGGLRAGHRYRFSLRPLTELQPLARLATNLDIVQAAVEMETDVDRLNYAFENAPRWVDEMFLERYQFRIADDVFAENVARLADDFEELMRGCRLARDETFTLLTMLKVALENERTLFIQLLKSRFGEKDRKRVFKQRAILKGQMDESREKNIAKMREGGIEPDVVDEGE